MIYNIKEDKTNENYTIISIDKNANEDYEINEKTEHFSDFFYVSMENKDYVRTQLENAKNKGLIKEYKEIFVDGEKDYFYYVVPSVPLYSRDESKENTIKQLRYLIVDLKKKASIYENDIYPQKNKFIYSNKIEILKDYTNENIPYIAFDIEVQGYAGHFPEVSKNFIFYIGAKGIDYKGNKVEFYKSVSDYTDNPDEYEEIGEKGLLVDFLKFLSESKPIIITGYNINNFDLFFINERLKRYGLEFDLGYDKIYQEINKDNPNGFFRNPLVKNGNSYFRKFLSEKGRIVIFDTYYYMFRIPIETAKIRYIYGTISLKNVSEFFKLLPKSKRVMIEGDKIWSEYLKNPKNMTQYLVDDVVEAELLYKKFSPVIFSMSNFANIPLESAVIIGNVNFNEANINNEFKHLGYLIPQKDNTPFYEEGYSGAYVQLLATGYFKPVAKMDFSSLYPNIILGYKIKPENDKHSVTLKALEKVVKLRLEYKKKFKEIERKDNKTEEDYKLMQDYEGKSASLKILINSYYGLLGFKFKNPRGNGFIKGSRYSDIKKASEVTKYGRYLISSAEEILLDKGWIDIEADTDSDIFTIPNTSYKDLEKKTWEMIGKFNDAFAKLGYPNIKFDLETINEGMLSIKKKNYVLFSKKDKSKSDDDYENYEVEIKGSSFLNFSESKVEKDVIESFMKFLIRKPTLKEINEKFNFLYLKSPLDENSKDFTDFCKTYEPKDLMHNFSPKNKEGYKVETSLNQVITKKYEERYNTTIKSDTTISYFISKIGKSISEKVRFPEEFDYDIVDYKKMLLNIKQKMIGVILTIYDTELKSNSNIKVEDNGKVKISDKKSKKKESEFLDEIFDRDWIESTFTNYDKTKTKSTQIINMNNHKINGTGRNAFSDFPELVEPYTEEYIEKLKTKVTALKNKGILYGEIRKKYEKYKELSDSEDTEELNKFIKEENLDLDYLIIFKLGLLDNSEQHE